MRFRARPTPHQAPRRALDATSTCVRFARAAATVDTHHRRPRQARQAAARAFGTSHLQAVFTGAGDGRNREQETWRQHQAHVTDTAVPVLDDAHDGLARPGTEPPRSGTGHRHRPRHERLDGR